MPKCAYILRYFFLPMPPTHQDRNESSEERNLAIREDHEKYSKTAPFHTIVGVYSSC